MDQRVQFIADCQRGVGFDLAELARRYGISRKTAWWIDRYDEAGPAVSWIDLVARRIRRSRRARSGGRGPAGRATASSDLGRQEAAEGGGDPAAGYGCCRRECGAHDLLDRAGLIPTSSDAPCPRILAGP